MHLSIRILNRVYAHKYCVRIKKDPLLNVESLSGINPVWTEFSEDVRCGIYYQQSIKQVMARVMRPTVLFSTNVKCIFALESPYGRRHMFVQYGRLLSLTDEYFPAQTPGEFSLIAAGSKVDTQNPSPYKQTNLEIFLFCSNTDLQSPPPSLPDVDAVVQSHPKVFFRLKTQCNPMV